LDRDDESAAGHYVTSGTTLVGLGSLASTLAFVLTLVFRVELYFIDGRAMGLLGLGFVALGIWMIRHGGVKQK
jgi:hypothetical protein